jgi:HEAT repeat protein
MDISRLAMSVVREAIQQGTAVELTALVPAIVEVLNRPDRLAQVSAASTLEAFGNKASVALPFLKMQLDGAIPYITTNALSAILAIESSSLDALTDKIVELLRSCEDIEAQRVLLDALGKLKSSGKRFVSEITDLSSNESIAIEAAEALFQITGNPKELQVVIKRYLQSDDPVEAEYGKELQQRWSEVPS